MELSPESMPALSPTAACPVAAGAAPMSPQSSTFQAAPLSPSVPHSSSPSPERNPGSEIIVLSPVQRSCCVIHLASSTDSSPLAMLPEVTDLTGTPAPHAAAQPAPQPAPQPVGRRLIYGPPSAWELSSCFDSDSSPLAMLPEVTDHTGTMQQHSLLTSLLLSLLDNN
ncbi:TPA: hypothetical protein ACH3X1_009187 [Trebouxia sp. C0004]